MTDKTWKRAERMIAAAFSTTRTGPLGRNEPDAVTSDLSIEVKTRKRLPSWLKSAMEQSVHNAHDGTTPVVILRENGWQHKDNLVIVRQDDFIRMMYGEVEHGA